MIKILGIKNMSETENKNTVSLIMNDLLKEKRADRRWRNIRFIAWFLLIAYIVINLLNYTGRPKLGSADSNNHVALVRLNGMISPEREFSADEVIPILQDAFSDKSAKGLIIDINSPGGTPVQAGIIHDAILTLKKKYNKKVIIVGEDLLTSGAYFVAVAGDKIYVNASTIIGSIGVIMKGFGFVDIMKKIGIERRVYISGNDKNRLDPFLPENPNDVKKVQTVMDGIRQNFVAAVLEGRKGKLKSNPDALFNGDFWSGQTAVDIGLADGIGNLMDVMNKEFNTTEYTEYGGTPTIFRRLNNQFSSVFDSFFYLSG